QQPRGADGPVRHVDRQLAGERAAARTAATRTAAVVPEARPRAGRRGRARAHGRGRRGVIDTHAHLDACEEVDAVLERAQTAGVGRVVTIGTGIDSCRAAL